MTSLLDLYRGAAIAPGTATKIGSQTASTTIETATDRRRRLLTTAIAQKKVDPSQLGPNDAALVGGISFDPSKAAAVKWIADRTGGAAHGVGGFLSNLGNDLTNFGLEFVPGLVSAGEAGVHDILHAPSNVSKNPLSLLGGPLAPSVASALEKDKKGLFDKIVEPAGKGVATDVKNIGLAATGDRAAAQALYQHPLNPLLDIGSVFSLGAGAAAKAGTLGRAGHLGEALADGGRLARISKSLQSLTARDRGYGTSQRPRVGTTVANRLVPRDYSARPLTKFFQSTSDRYVQSRLPGSSVTRNLQDQMAARKFDRYAYAQFNHDTARAIENAFAPVTEQFAGVSDVESEALHLALNGANTRTKLMELMDTRRKALDGGQEKGYNASDYPDVPREWFERQAHISEEVMQLAMHPNEAMVEAAEAHAADVSKGHEQLDPRISEGHEAHIKQVQEFLDEHADMLGLPAQEPALHALALNYVPSMEAQGLKLHQPGRIESAIRGAEHIDPETGRARPYFIKPPQLRDLAIPKVTRQNLLSEDKPSFLHASSGEAFLAGATRTDMRVFLDHIAQREKFIVESAYKQSITNRAAYRDSDGVPVKVMSRADIPEGIDRSKVTIIHPTFPIRWYKTETNVAKEAVAAMRRLREEGIDPSSPEGERVLDQLSEAHAKAFIQHNWGALKQPGVIVDNEFAKYQYDFATANDPFNNRGMRAMKKFIDKWRMWTLAFMPRWAINTAAGTFLQAMVYGAVDPRHWFMANRLSKEAQLGADVGHSRFRVDPEGIPRGLPPGVRLRDTASSSVMELPHQEPGWLQKGFGVDSPITAHRLAGGVQSVEDHFRTGMYVKSLKQEYRQHLAEMGETITSWMRKNESIDSWVRDALSNQKVLDHALEETNKFAYNYGHLGPWERRYVRMAVPFWGWYKFISKLMWRLPAEYPGRTRVMNFLSQAGLEQQNELGPIPDWLRGSIILNLKLGHLNYLSSKGLNPFSQFANPLATGHGAVNGLLSLGQMNPVIQAAISAYGLNPQTGDSVAISPQDSVITGLFGQHTNAQGEQIAPGSVAPVWRFIGGLINAFPEAQIATRYATGHSQYPESVPFFHYRPMSTNIAPQVGGPLGAAIAETGLMPKTYNLTPAQAKMRANAALYARKHAQAQLKLQQKLNSP